MYSRKATTLPVKKAILENCEEKPEKFRTSTGSTAVRPQMVKIASITARIIALLDFISAVQYTVPLKGKLTVSTRSSKLDSRVAKVETFEFRDARIESRGSRVKDRESRNEEFRNIHFISIISSIIMH